MRTEFWAWFVYLDVKFWFLALPAAIVLMLIGWHAAHWPRGLRWAAFGAAALLAVPFPVAAVLVIIDEIRSAANLAALQRTLDHDETVAGLPLSSGSRIYFRDQAHSSVVSIDLSRATNIRGMHMVGTLTWNDFGHVWSGTLAEDQRLGGWPCRAGLVEFDNDGMVTSCELAAVHELLGFALPPGTNVTRGNADKPWAFRLPPDAGLAIPALSTVAPAGVSLSVASDGRVESINSGRGQTIVVRGVPLNSMNVYLRGDQVVASLAEPFMVAGEMRPAETGIRIDLSTGAISLASKNWWLSE
jgi:hypothetical protein